ncbi:MAG TPA: DinB family protein [Bryobacteraceae bacterium]|nr:DinB family protein [Bryobacteraceae bacterium]
MKYERVAISDDRLPRAAAPAYQHIVDTYASETNKTASVWRMFAEDDLGWRPHERSSTVAEIMRHQLLSERRFFAEFLGSLEPSAKEALPEKQTVEAFAVRLVDLAVGRLGWMSAWGDKEWLGNTQFFDVRRERIWVFWRRVLHSAHHRTQLTVYLRLLNRTVPSTYGPTADVTWSGADPTLTV